MKLAALLLLAVSCFGQSVSSITFDGTGDSSTRVIFNVSSSFNAMRVRYGTASCSGGSGGTVQTNGTSSATYQLFGMTTDLSGLAPSTTYHACPEVSNNGGSTWSSGADATFTTTARSHPLPFAPLAVSTTFPAQSGSTINVLADCSNLQSQINAANPGDTIVVPAGTICTGYYTTPAAPDAISFTPSNVVTSTMTIAVTSSGFSENQEVRLSTAGANTNCLPGTTIFPYGLNCDKSGEIHKGGRYYVHIVDGSHVQLLTAPSGSPAIPGWVNFTADGTSHTITFNPTWQTPAGFSYLGAASVPGNTPIQFVTTGTLPAGLSVNTTYYTLTACSANQNAACTTQVSTTPSGSPVNITSAGTGTHTIVDQGLGTMYIAPAPTQSGPWVLITSGGTLPPAGIRWDPSFDAQAFHLRNNAPNVATPVFSTGILAHNWRLVGAIFDTGTNNDYLTSTDPRPYCGGPTTYQDSSFVIFDRVHIHGPGYPNRFGCSNNAATMFIDGFNVGFINYYFDGLDFWHPWYSGLVPTRTSTSQVTATAGTGHGGKFTTTTTGTTTINFTGGSATGTGLVYMAMDGTMQVQSPTGTSAACSTIGTSCTLSTAASPAYPVDGNGRTAALKLFTVTLVSGAVTAVAASDATTTANPQVIEGCNCIISGNGPGPYILSNGYFSGVGLPMHFDDGGGPLLTRGDYTVTRNTFNVPQTQFVTGPSSDGLWYGNRQPIEWKGGQRINADGNIFQGVFEQINPVSVSMALTPRSGGYITDVSFTNNSILNSSGGLNLISPIDSFAPISKPGARQLIQNNLFVLNGWVQTVTGASPRGWMAQGGYAMEDLTVNHNTVYNNLGGAPAWIHWINYPAGGVVMENSIYFYTGNAPALQDENVANCLSLADKAFMDCAFTSGPVTPSYTFTDNILVPSWADTSVPTGFVGTSTVTSAFSGLANFIPASGSQPTNVATVNFLANLGLSPSSPYHNMASDGKDPGYDPTSLMAAQGALTFISAVPTSTSALLTYTVYAGTGETCYVQVGSGGFTADSGTGTNRTYTVMGLSNSTLYSGNLYCPSNTAAFSFTTYGPSSLTCDLNNDGLFNIIDVQLMTNQVLGTAPCTNNLSQTGMCNVVDIQRVINAALGQACKIGT